MTAIVGYSGGSRHLARGKFNMFRVYHAYFFIGERPKSSTKLNGAAPGFSPLDSLLVIYLFKVKERITNEYYGNWLVFLSFVNMLQFTVIIYCHQYSYFDIVTFYYQSPIECLQMVY